MLKMLSVILLSLVMMCCGSVLHAVTLTDHFDTPHDYLSSLSGTIWDGLMADVPVANLLAVNSIDYPGALSFSTTGTDNVNPGLLYVTVPANNDFQATVKIVDGNWFGLDFNQDGNWDNDFLAWHSSGLMAWSSASGTTDSVAAYLFSNPQWDATFIGRAMIDGAEINQNTAADFVRDASSAGELPSRYLRLERVGSHFLGSYSADGSTWTQWMDHNHPNMIGDLYVGIPHCTFSTETPIAVLDDFSITFEEVIPGDTDGDGDVDLDDYNNVNDNLFKMDTSRITGDLNGDEITDFADFRILKNNYPFPLADANSTVGPVPEPTGAALLGLLALGMMGWFTLFNRNFSLDGFRIYRW